MFYCDECGGHYTIDESGVSMHVGTDGAVDHEADADHVATGETSVGGADRPSTEGHKLTLALALTVEYDLNGEDPQFAKDRLEDMVRSAVGNGLLTGDSPMEVDEWRVRIREVEAISDADSGSTGGDDREAPTGLDSADGETGANTRYEISFLRDSEGGALILHLVATEPGLHEDDLFRRLYKAVSRWLVDTERGRDLLEQSGFHLNILDLAFDEAIKDGALDPFLKQQGIVSGRLEDVFSDYSKTERAQALSNLDRFGGILEWENS
ncbi:hypothetical protein TK90_2720 (plasmid) [Thioalkalivibrio sp. K90mix]|uniref:hypothetical protein n=1 Tax=Thioalkalivibrio sp. (strain K90mix) TaxID=396595 RepID=UPI000195A4D7|nr:hypothetical protein [Thioalkalivibrio sp. K90mix]ADC73206.1 hypothetical protein TK90_2720 [Thioalkalivibrio sp. K90mix]